MKLLLSKLFIGIATKNINVRLRNIFIFDWVPCINPVSIKGSAGVPTLETTAIYYPPLVKFTVSCPLQVVSRVGVKVTVAL